LIEEQLRQLVRTNGWTYAEVALENLAPFARTYGFVAADEVLRYVGLLLSNVIEEYGEAGDFLGQANEHTFVLITYSSQAERMLADVQARFADGILTHYNFLDTEQGGVYQANGSLAPLMRLGVGLVAQGDGTFADIREITEAAAADRQAMRSR
jgi:GGDEF domain-containing protein